MSSTRMAQWSAGVPCASGALTSTLCARSARTAAVSRLAAAVASRKSWASAGAAPSTSTTVTTSREIQNLIENPRYFTLRSLPRARPLFSNSRPNNAPPRDDFMPAELPYSAFFIARGRTPFQEDSYEQVYPQAGWIRGAWRGSRRAAAGAGDRARQYSRGAAWRRAGRGISDRRRSGTERTRSRRVGHRRNQGPADWLHQDCRHRRPGPLHGAGAAGRELQRVGARLRPRRLQAGADETDGDGDDAARQRREHAAGSREGVSRQLLAVDARGSPGGRFPGHRPAGQWHLAEHDDAGELDAHAEVELQLLPPAGQRHHARSHARVQGQAGAEDARRGVGMAPGCGRARHQYVQRAELAGTAARAEGMGRLVARDR